MVNHTHNNDKVLKLKCLKKVTMHVEVIQAQRQTDRLDK